MRIVIESYGCTMNQGEAESILRKLSVLGHRVSHVTADSGEWRSADVVVLATCIVIETTERNMLKRMRAVVESGRKLIVTGCLPTGRAELMDEFPEADFCGPGDWDSVIAAVKTYDMHHKQSVVDCSGTEIPTGSRIEPVTCILPIAQGCLGSCTYCITRRARGPLKSRPMEEIVEDAAAAIHNGAREIQLTAQDTAAYGRDGGSTLADLLRKITSLEFEGMDNASEYDFRVRVGMMNPNNVYPILDDLIDVFRHPRIFTFFHIPVQSGDDTVLEMMNRGYDAALFENIVGKLRGAFGDELTLSTDVIVGFPGETEAAFQRTRELLERLTPDSINVTRYSTRPHTPAAALRPTIHGRQMKAWSRELTALRIRIAEERNKRFIGQRFRVMLLEKGYGGSILGRTDFYKQVVVIPGDRTSVGSQDLRMGYLMGSFAEVEVTGAASPHLESMLV